MTKILSTVECEKILENISLFERSVREYSNNINKSIKTFNNNEIVQSFYASGNLGREMEEEIKKLETALTRYFDNISDRNGLIGITKTVINDQKELLNRSYKGGN